MLCKLCGMENPEHSKFCAQCGAVLTAQTEPMPPVPSEPMPPVSSEPMPHSENAAQESARAQYDDDSPTLMWTPASAPQEPVSAFGEPPYVAPNPAPTPEPAPMSELTPAVRRKKKKSKLVPILIGVIVALIGAVAALYFTGVFDRIFGQNEKAEVIDGYYVLRSAQISGEELPDEALTSRGYELFVLVRENHSAVFFNGTALIEATCKNGELKPAEGASMAYRIQKNTLTLTTAEGEFVFEKSDDTAPNLDELAQALATPLEIGYFKLTYVYTLDEDDEFSAGEIGMDDAFLLLYADGTGIFCSDRLQDMRWENGVIYPAGSKSEAIEYTVTDREFVLLGDDAVLQFERSDETPPDIEALRQSLEPNLPGYYLLTEMSSDGMMMDIEAMASSYEALGMHMPFLLVHEDGTAEMYLGTLILDMQWDETAFWSVAAPAQKIPYEATTDTLTIADEESKMVFKRSDDAPPDMDELREKMQEPQNENPSDADLTGEYELYAFDMGSGMVESEGVTMTLNADGTGIYGGAGVEMAVTWSKENLKVGTVTYTYEVEADGTLIIEGSDGKFWFRRISAPESRWSGDWYGFWIMNDCTGTMAEYDGQWWDLCARCTDNGDGTYTITFWDEDMNSIDDPLGVVEFKLTDGGGLVASDGWFYMDTADGELSTDNDLTAPEDMLTLQGTYADADCSYTYSLYLRPWGTTWDDLGEDWLPYYYTQWYLPLIEAGETMPNVFETP